MIAYTPTQLTAFLQSALTDGYGADKDLLPEVAMVTALARTVFDHDEQYVVLSEDGEEPLPSWVNALERKRVLDWKQEDNPALTGYGALLLVRSAQGNGLLLHMGGSPSQRCGETWILPASLMGYMGDGE